MERNVNVIGVLEEPRTTMGKKCRRKRKYNSDHSVCKGPCPRSFDAVICQIYLLRSLELFFIRVNRVLTEERKTMYVMKRLLVEPSIAPLEGSG